MWLYWHWLRSPRVPVSTRMIITLVGGGALGGGAGGAPLLQLGARYEAGRAARRVLARLPPVRIVFANDLESFSEVTL